jgi:uncharacterized membrane protein YfhO
MIDGQPAALRAANVGFQGLVIERGRHHVELRYRNPLVIACAWLSALSAFVMILLSFIPARTALPAEPRGDSETPS